MTICVNTQVDYAVVALNPQLAGTLFYLQTLTHFSIDLERVQQSSG